MKTKLTLLDKIKKELNVDVEKVQIDLAMETIDEGRATIEAEVFAEGEPVMIVNGEDRIPLPVGEYNLDNGMVLVVEEEGVIAMIREMQEEVEEMPAEEEAVAAADAPTETPLPKAIVESVVKETKFSKEEMEAKDAKIAELEAKILELSKVEETPVEEEVKEEVVEEVELAKPIAHNPEPKEVQHKGFKIGANGNRGSLQQRVMSRIANMK